MENNELINKFGYCEMYEWSQIPIDQYRYGRFVEFDENYPDKIRFVVSGKSIIGVASINYNGTISDDMDHWWLENQFDDYGDILMRNETLAVGIKQYDNNKEMSYIKTQKYEHVIPIKRDIFDKEKKFKKRSTRPEWSSVTLMGKAIVTDYGRCKPGTLGQVQISKDLQLAGTLEPYDGNPYVKSYHVIRRVSKNTVMILVK